MRCTSWGWPGAGRYDPCGRPSADEPPPAEVPTRFLSFSAVLLRYQGDACVVCASLTERCFDHSGAGPPEPSAEASDDAENAELVAFLAGLKLDKFAEKLQAEDYQLVSDLVGADDDELAELGLKKPQIRRLRGALPSPAAPPPLLALPADAAECTALLQAQADCWHRGRWVLGRVLGRGGSGVVLGARTRISGLSQSSSHAGSQRRGSSVRRC